MSIEGQGHFFTIYFPGFVCFVLYLDKISGERLQDHWSSGSFYAQNIDREAVLTSTHNLCFRAKIRKIMYTPVNPSFTTLKWGVKGVNYMRMLA